MVQCSLKGHIFLKTVNYESSSWIEIIDYLNIEIIIFIMKYIKNKNEHINILL